MMMMMLLLTMMMLLLLMMMVMVTMLLLMVMMLLCLVSLAEARGHPPNAVPWTIGGGNSHTPRSLWKKPHPTLADAAVHEGQNSEWAAAYF